MKTIAAVITAFLMSAGLLVVSSPAHAVYPKSITTVCSAQATKLVIKPSTKPRIAFSAASTAGNGSPSGTVTVTFTRSLTGKVVRTTQRAYSGTLAVYKFARLRRGNYIVTLSLDTGASSVFKNCAATTRQIVRRR